MADFAPASRWQPVKWTAERDGRGGPASSLPRCPVKGCIVRYRDGEDRLCREHKRDEAQSRTLDSRARWQE